MGSAPDLRKTVLKMNSNSSEQFETAFLGSATRWWFLLSSEDTWFCAWGYSIKATIKYFL